MSGVAKREPSVPGAHPGLSTASSLIAGRLDVPLGGEDSKGVLLGTPESLPLA